ncbi:MAG TPA: bifunctional phosphopantothenoylcysteine decarboxylase/phosphopantothenate--cysteine ligase CoaBC [Solirubrobacteraceae bacterium]|jgi:phosphopantothenoylcysteine decarboxylase / phosphopantothenate---cysteine ligase|nr:bifunctional phosphopantothenoylcysteine decarboxylase/phosphopantothenate--cysteine ligase CoaBC [Solirubrobacteraceae bacterium]
MARLLLGVTGGIAAYKALEAARLAVKRGHAVRVIQTPTSERFVGRASFEGITGAPVLTSEFDADPARGSYPGEPLGGRVQITPISHLALAERAELYLIAPASANTLAKLAHGHADNLVTTAALAAACPVAVAPAMNNRMYLNPATQANLELLRARGVTMIPPREGELASHGEHGIGRLPEPAELLEACEALLRPPSLKGLRVLVTAGGTREPIDSVRFVGNRSSGRMGYALAREAARRGAAVTVIAANVGLETPARVRVVPVRTAAELATAVRNEVAACDVLLMSAAVADFRPAGAVNTKLGKEEGVPKLELEPTEDVLNALVDLRRADQTIVGFAAEHGHGGVERGRGKLERKRLDAIVINDIAGEGIGFDSDDNEVTILAADGAERHVPRTRKDRVAEAVLDEVERLRTTRGGTDGARADSRSPARV